MRFLLDQDVDARVGHALRSQGHDAWTAYDADLNKVPDDALTVYASDKDAVLVTHDCKFSQRCRRNVVGKHVWLRCHEWEAAALLLERLPEVQPLLDGHPDILVAASNAGCDAAFAWS